MEDFGVEVSGDDGDDDDDKFDLEREIFVAQSSGLHLFDSESTRVNISL